MTHVLLRLVVFFPVVCLVPFVWFVLLIGFPLWFVIVLVSLFALVLGLVAHFLLNLLLPAYVRHCLRAEARRAEMYQQGW